MNNGSEMPSSGIPVVPRFCDEQVLPALVPWCSPAVLFPGGRQR